MFARDSLRFTENSWGKTRYINEKDEWVSELEFIVFGVQYINNFLM